MKTKPKKTPRIAKSLYTKSSGSYSWDNGAVAFTNPGKRNKTEEK